MYEAAGAGGCALEALPALGIIGAAHVHQLPELAIDVVAQHLQDLDDGLALHGQRQLVEHDLAGQDVVREFASDVVAEILEGQIHGSTLPVCFARLG